MVDLEAKEQAPPTETEWRAYRKLTGFVISAEGRMLDDGRAIVRVRLGRKSDPVATGYSIVRWDDGDDRRATFEEALVALLEALRSGQPDAVVVRGGDRG